MGPVVVLLVLGAVLAAAGGRKKDDDLPDVEDLPEGEGEVEDETTGDEDVSPPEGEEDSNDTLSPEDGGDTERPPATNSGSPPPALVLEEVVPGRPRPFLSPNPAPKNMVKPSGKRCQVDKQPYDAGVFNSPETVIRYLRHINPKWAAIPSTNIKSAAWKQAVKEFQAYARSQGLFGMQGASSKLVDGVVGPCTLRSLYQAVYNHRVRMGWPPHDDNPES